MSKATLLHRPALRAGIFSRSAAALVALLVGTTASPHAAAAQIAVVVNRANPVDELSIETLRRLFLGQAGTFLSGEHARPQLAVAFCA